VKKAIFNKKVILFVAVFFFLMINRVYAKEFEFNKINSIFNNFYDLGVIDYYKNDFSNERIGMANPAAVYCLELGYQYKIVDTEKGQKGICIFPDKSECEEWQFLTGKCGQSYSYCARQGYDLIIKTDGKNPFSREYAVCVHKGHKGVEIGSVTDLFSLSEKSTRGSSMEKSSSASEEGFSIESLPSYFDWRNVNGSNWMTTVKDQVGCGSCWAFSAVGVTEAVTNIYKNNPNSTFDLSEEYLVSNCSDAGNCCGGQPDKAFEFISYKGIPDEGCMPYADSSCSCDSGCSGSCTFNTGSQCSNAQCGDRCSNWQDRLTKIDETGHVPSNRDIIKQYLLDKGPLSASIGIGDAYGGYFDGNGIYRCTNDSEANHAVVITGFNDTGGYWILKNSWGSTWNGDGYFKLGYGECFIENWVIYADSKVNCGDTITGNTVLKQDLLNCPGNGITIGADNVVLDCQGHTINGTSTGDNYGIDNSNGYSNVTIKNCVIKGFYMGMEFYSDIESRGTGEVIINNNVSSSSYSGIRLAYILGKSIISGNIVSDSGTIGTGGAGIEVTYSNYNVLTDNIANNNVRGFAVALSSNNTLINNIVSNNNNTGIWVQTSSNNKFFNNYFYNNAINAWDDGTNYWNMTKSSDIINGHLIGRWKLDEGTGTTAIDSSVFRNNGNIYGASWFTGCKYGKCLKFDGVNDYVEVPNSVSLNIIGPMTIESWIYPQFGSQNRNFAAVTKMVPSGSGAGSKFALELGWGTTPVPITFWIYDGDWQGLSSTTNLADNIWYHVVGVYDGSYIRIYINGVEEGTPVAQGNPSSSYETLQIGSSQKENRWGKWIIDEVKIYNRALSAEEIRQEYANGTSGKNIIGGPYIGGNFWSDYNGVDTSNPSDGIGDTFVPYTSNGNIANGGDYLPLTTTKLNFTITSCPSTINNPGIYALNQSLSSNGTCITINSTNVTLDCKGYTIMGNSTGYGISNIGFKNVTVKNCVIKNFTTGIYLYSSSNNLLTNNTANLNQCGIDLYNSSNNKIISNTANLNYWAPNSDCGNGIFLQYSSNNNIYNNIANSNPQGIYLQSFSNNNILTSNTVNLNTYGIVSSSSFNNTITGNTVNLNTDGIILYPSSNNNTLISNTANFNQYSGIDFSSSNNILTNNTASANKYGIVLNQNSNSILTNNTANSNSYYGIWLQYASNNKIISNTANSNQYGILLQYSSNNNNITSNTLNSNSQYGIYLTGVLTGNIIYNNYFNNSVNAYDDGNNFWNTTKTLGTNIIGGPYIGGNFWHDYTGIDTDGDGLGNTKIPYNSSGNITTGGDYLPLIILDTTPPAISIISPQNTTYSTTSVPLTFTVNEPTSWCGYSLDGNVTIPSCANNTLKDLTNGGHNVIIYANDTSGNMNSSRVYFTVLIKPDLVIDFIWNSSRTINYRIRNQGSAMAGYSYSRLYVDGSYRANGYVTSLVAGAYSNENFSYTWICSGINDIVKVCADANNNVDEVNEANNCLETTLACIKTCQAEGGRCMSGSGGCIVYCRRLGKEGYCELPDPRLGYYPGCSPGNCCCLCG
jgi:parallel beta-helix repeat protein